MAHDEHGHSMEASKTADHRRIVGKAAIAVKFFEVFENALDEIERVWPIRMARELDALEGGG